MSEDKEQAQLKNKMIKLVRQEDTTVEEKVVMDLLVDLINGLPEHQVEEQHILLLHQDCFQVYLQTVLQS
jgi:hypothetical protein